MHPGAIRRLKVYIVRSSGTYCRALKGRRASHVLNAAGVAIREAGAGDLWTELGGGTLNAAAVYLSLRHGDPTNFTMLAGVAAIGSPIRNVLEDSAALVNLAHRRKLSSLLLFLVTFEHLVALEIALELLLAVAVEL